MREKETLRAIRMYLKKEYGILSVKYHGSVYGETGVADLLCAVPLRNSQGDIIPNRSVFLALEIKRNNKCKPTVAQETWLRVWAEAGAVTGVASSIVDVERILARAGLI